MAKEIINPTNLTEYPNAFKRQGAFPLEAYSLFNTIKAAQDYAKESPLSYVGQIITIVGDTGVKTYVIADKNGKLQDISQTWEEF